jgi:hypothetical protein
MPRCWLSRPPVPTEDRVRHDCGMTGQELHGVMGRLTDSGVLKEWQICPDSGDVHWTLAPGQR